MYRHPVSSMNRPGLVLGVVTVTVCVGWVFFPPIQLPQLDSRPWVCVRLDTCWCLLLLPLLLLPGMEVYPRFRVC